MAAPKKCKSLMKRKIAHGNKFKMFKSKGFNNFGVNICNLKTCNTCGKTIKSHFSCYKCVVKQTKQQTYFL